jgi:hypothetical protein
MTGIRTECRTVRVSVDRNDDTELLYGCRHFVLLFVRKDTTNRRSHPSCGFSPQSSARWTFAEARRDARSTVGRSVRDQNLTAGAR